MTLAAASVFWYHISEMDNTTLFDPDYEARKRPLLSKLIKHVRPIYTAEELEVLRIDPVNRGILSQPSGRGFVNRDILETVLGNLLECVAPGSHNALDVQQRNLEDLIEEIADQLYAMIAQSLRAAGDSGEIGQRALESTLALLWDLPRLKERALWNRFASLKDPAVWDAYVLDKGELDHRTFADLDFFPEIERSIEDRDFDHYREFLRQADLGFAFAYQMQLVTSTYPGWRVLFYHDIAHALTRSGPAETASGIARMPVPLLPRAISELGGRYYQADLHPETRIGDANFLDHPHRGMTTGQTGAIGSGCVIYPCTMGGLSDKIKVRHPQIGDYVLIGTDTKLLGPVQVGDRSTVGTGTEIFGRVKTGSGCQIASLVVIGTVLAGSKPPGEIRLEENVRVGDGTIIENVTEHDLVIPKNTKIPARSHVVNDGSGNPKFV